MNSFDGSLEARNHAAELVVRAERKLGELLAVVPERRGGKSNLHGGSSSPLPNGINHSQSHRWQRIAEIPEPDAVFLLDLDDPARVPLVVECVLVDRVGVMLYRRGTEMKVDHGCTREVQNTVFRRLEQSPNRRHFVTIAVS